MPWPSSARTRLVELTWLVGYYGALALALEILRPPHPGGSEQE